MSREEVLARARVCAELWGFQPAPSRAVDLAAWIRAHDPRAFLAELLADASDLLLGPDRYSDGQVLRYSTTPLVAAEVLQQERDRYSHRLDACVDSSLLDRPGTGRGDLVRLFERCLEACQFPVCRAKVG